VLFQRPSFRCLTETNDTADFVDRPFSAWRMAQGNEPKVEIMKDIPRKEEFQKYLEKAGVIDQLTKLLVSLYENPDRPENALDYIRNFLGANLGANANV